MDLAEIKNWCATERPVYSRRIRFEWLIVEVERLTKENGELRDRAIANAEEAGLQVAVLQSSLTRSKSEGRREGMEEAAKIAEGPHGPWGSPLESQRIAFDIRQQVGQDCKEIEESAKLAKAEGRREGLEAAAKMVIANAQRFRDANTYRGKVNQMVDEAAGWVDGIAAAIRKQAQGN